MPDTKKKTKTSIHVLEPKKCIVDNVEILAFESEELLNYYTVWHDALVNKRLNLNTAPAKGKQRISNSNSSEESKSRHPRSSTSASASASASATPAPATSATKTTKAQPTASLSATQVRENDDKLAASHRTHNRDEHRSPPQAAPLSQVQASNRPQATCSVPSSSSMGPSRHRAPSIGTCVFMWEPNSQPSVPPGYAVINPVCNLTRLPALKHTYRKVYNKYRGIQLRRNSVVQNKRAELIQEMSEASHVTPWVAYTALQTLQHPQVPNPSNHSNAKRRKHMPPPPAYVLTIDSLGNIISYNNRINPQQVAGYKRKSQQPIAASSKKSSTASYDVNEIMEVLVNSDKTNVIISRNGSAYTHSVNPNINGIVSTQLHIQERSYLDSMFKFYADEAKRLEEERRKLDNEPTSDELIRKFLPI